MFESIIGAQPHGPGISVTRILLVHIILFQVLISPSIGWAGPNSQGDTPQTRAEALLGTLTPEEKVGQLFLVTFDGSRADQETLIYELINTYHIGGVVLRRDMNNFVAAPGTLEGAYSLIAELQRAEGNASLASRTDALSGEEYTPVYIPVFVAMSQEGDGFPNDQLLGVLSPQPNAMMLGATWDPDLARAAGQLLGEELSAIGVNMLLGPSLDVLETPRPESTGDLGTRSFGGDPYWVGRLGRAFIEGVHLGSKNRVAVVAKHLPGHGGLDRPPEEEVPTVRKSLSELTQIELPPFFAVTGESPTPEGTADAMLLAHIRYQGFQGNIRTTTNPISFDPQAFNELLALPAFAQWRQDGGLIISDSLGSRAVRRSYDSTEQVFNSPLVARDAFLAGNDLLYTGNFIANNDPDTFTSIVRTLQFFAQKYREDQAFAERVDASVERILTLKYELYPSFTLNSVLLNASLLDDIGTQDALFFEISRRAASLFDPAPDELTSLIPEPPGPFEQIVIITDSFSVQQCSTCPEQAPLPSNTLAQATLRLYGPGTGDQISPANLLSFTFGQLRRTLDETIEVDQDPLLANLQRAEWVVFALLREESARAESLALGRLLSERPDLIRDKKVVVFALNAPYYLDATDITNITAYYGLYGKNQRVADVAARLLFQEISAPGASPVSIEGVGYDLSEATSPNPDQRIPIEITRIFPVPDIDVTQSAVPQATRQPSEPTLSPTFQAGDFLNLRAGPILDRNGHIVPDNNPVTFSVTIFTEGTTLQRQVSAIAIDGVAQATYSIEDEGNLEIFAASGDPQARSDVVHFDIIGINPAGIALQATQTAQAMLLATPSTEAPSQAFTTSSNLGKTSLVDWFLSLLISGFAGLFAYQAGISSGKVRWAVRWGLATIIGGLFAGSYLSLSLPGSESAMTFSGKWGLVLVVLAGCAIGWILGWAWKAALKKRT
ncbi:MAG: glycoside hydrolase family 3 N-terminal domain-containing protein [Anaerolineales bacterium]